MRRRLRQCPHGHANSSGSRLDLDAEQAVHHPERDGKLESQLERIQSAESEYRQ